MIRSHVALGADTGIASDLRIGHVTGMTGSTTRLDAVAAVTADFTHLRALFLKTGALHPRLWQSTSLFVAEATLGRIAAFEIAGTTPAGVEPHAMPAGTMFMKSLLMTFAADRSGHCAFAAQHRRMIVAVTFTTSDFPSMRAALPERHCRRSLALMTAHAVVRRQGKTCTQEQCHHCAKNTTYFQIFHFCHPLIFRSARHTRVHRSTLRRAICAAAAAARCQAPAVLPAQREVRSVTTAALYRAATNARRQGN